MFYMYDQNNSGGSFIVNDDVAHTVFIEADSPSEADEKAEEIGIYFDDGYEVDCECCGTRWDRAWAEGTETPTIYGTPIEERNEMWAKPGQPYAYVYYANGDKVAHFSKGA